MPETADVGDAGSVFAPASGAHKRPMMERIHWPLKRSYHPRKRICGGGGRVSGRSRENIISGLIPRVEIVEHQPAEVLPVNVETGAPKEIQEP